MSYNNLKTFQVANSSLKCYSTKKKESKNVKKAYNSSYKYGPAHSESNIPSVEFSGTHKETNKVRVVN